MADQYEADYMTSGDRIVHRDKRVSRGMAAILAIWGPFCWGLALLIGLGNATASKPVPAASLPYVVAGIVALGFAFIFMGVAFSVLRSVVSKDELHVKYGLWGPTIPLRNIHSCTVTDYDWTKFGGWGIRRSMSDNSWAYVPGPGQVVEVQYEEDGEKRTIQIGADNALKLAKEINAAREAQTNTRFAIEVDDAAEQKVAEAEVEAEAEAEAEATANAEAERP